MLMYAYHFNTFPNETWFSSKKQWNFPHNSLTRTYFDILNMFVLPGLWKCCWLALILRVACNCSDEPPGEPLSLSARRAFILWNKKAWLKFLKLIEEGFRFTFRRVKSIFCLKNLDILRKNKKKTKIEDSRPQGFTRLTRQSSWNCWDLNFVYFAQPFSNFTCIL